MAIASKMPGIGCNCVETTAANNSIIGHFGIVRIKKVGTPGFSIRNFGEIIVAIEKNMWYVLIQ